MRSGPHQRYLYGHISHTRIRHGNFRPELGRVSNVCRAVKSLSHPVHHPGEGASPRRMCLKSALLPAHLDIGSRSETLSSWNTDAPVRLVVDLGTMSSFFVLSIALTCSNTLFYIECPVLGVSSHSSHSKTTPFTYHFHLSFVCQGFSIRYFTSKRKQGHGYRNYRRMVTNIFQRFNNRLSSSTGNECWNNKFFFCSPGGWVIMAFHAWLHNRCCIPYPEGPISYCFPICHFVSSFDQVHALVISKLQVQVQELNIIVLQSTFK